MTWSTIKLNDGTSIPSIAIGTWQLGGGDVGTGRVEQALEVGFAHIDTAQMYGNEAEVGRALKETGLSRSDVYITTKWSGTNGLDIPTSIRNSVANLGVDYVDLYLIHFPSLAVPDIPTVWSQMEQVKADGLAKSIGVSNFTENQLAILLASAKVKPVVNQIQLHPYAYRQQLPTIEYAKQNGIVIEAYSPLVPITRRPGGPLDEPLKGVASKYGATPEQILLAWAKAKGTIPVTTSSKKLRLEGYMAAGDIELETKDIESLDTAGAAGSLSLRSTVRDWIVDGMVIFFFAAATYCLYRCIDSYIWSFA